MSTRRHTTYTYEHYDRQHDEEHVFPLPFDPQGDPEHVYLSENGLHVTHDAPSQEIEL